MFKRMIISIKTFLVTLLAIFCLIGFLPIQNAHCYLIQEGAKDMEEVTSIAQNGLQQLKEGKFQRMIFCYCRTEQLKPYEKSFWVVGAPYWDEQEKAEALFNLRVDLRDEFGCQDKPVIIELKTGDSITKLPCYHMLSRKQQGMAIFTQANKLKENASSQDDMKDALKGYEEAQGIFRAAGADYETGITLSAIGSIYQSLGQYQKSLEYYEKSLLITRKIGVEQGEAATLNNIGLVYKLLGQYQKSLEYYEESLTKLKKIGDVKNAEITLNNLEKVKRLVDKKGSEVNAKSDVDSHTALKNTDNLNVVKVPLDKSVNAKDKTKPDASVVKAETEMTMYIAAMSGNIKEVQRLLNDEGVNVNANVGQGFTALIGVCLGAPSPIKVEMAKLLLDKGADLNSKNKEGKTALIEASTEGNLEMVKLLLDRGADVNAKDNNGVRAITFAKPEVANLLKSYGATETLPDTTRNPTPEVPKEKIDTTKTEKLATSVVKESNINIDLIEAATHSNLGEVKRLLNEGADVNSRTDEGLTPLIAAYFGGNIEILRLLLDKGADVNSKATEGVTPLIAACYGGHLEFVRLLLDKGADINSRTDKGGTALIAACNGEHIEILRLLLDKGADVNAKDNYGGTLLLFASREGRIQVVKFLLD